MPIGQPRRWGYTPRYPGLRIEPQTGVAPPDFSLPRRVSSQRGAPVRPGASPLVAAPIAMDRGEEIKARAKAGIQGPATKTVQTRTRQVTRAPRSPELDAAINTMIERIGGLRAGMGEAFGGYQESFDPMMRALMNRARAQGSAASTALGQSMLGAGLGPGEAAGEAGRVYMERMQQAEPLLAQLLQAQAHVPIERMGALQGLEQALGLPLLAQVQAPYERGIAGQIMTGTQDQTINDLLARQQLAMAQQQAMRQAQAAESDLALRQYLGELGAQTDLQRAQMQMQTALAGQQAGLRGQIGAAQIGAGARMGAAEMGQQTAMAQLLARQQEAGLGREFELGRMGYGAALEQQAMQQRQEFAARESALERASREAIVGAKTKAEQPVDLSQFQDIFVQDLMDELAGYGFSPSAGPQIPSDVPWDYLKSIAGVAAPVGGA